MGTLNGKVALVTGAGRGVGEAVAFKLASEGASVVATDLDGEPLSASVQAIKEAGGQAVALEGDVTAPDFGDRAIDTMVETYGGVDIIVNNAGYIWNTTIQNITDEQWYSMIDVHATAPFRILRAASRFIRGAVRLEASKGAVPHRKVVNVSSMSGLYGGATQLAYSAAKASLGGITRSLAKEWGRYNVNVNSVAFGWIETRLTHPYEGEPDSIDVMGRPMKVGMEAGLAGMMRTLIPLGRPGTTEEAAGSVYLFCIPESDYISGQIIVCGGGLLL